MAKQNKSMDFECGDSGLMAVDSLAFVRTPAGDKALAQMFAVTLDAAYAESRTCAALVRGKALLPALQALDLRQVRLKCERVYASAMRDYKLASPEKGCNPEAVTRTLVEWIIGQIEAGKKCEPWNID
ncbi:MAG: hypothetical protein LBF91_05645 [Azoarcus sp.]|jgi:hypothetical protein|nr:hypothetical protein [Azoarcus sp.]